MKGQRNNKKKMVKCAEEHEALVVHTATERWEKRRAACERWKQANRPYYLEQKRRLANRPEYLARRRELYAVRSAAENANLSTEENVILDFTRENGGHATPG